MSEPFLAEIVMFGGNFNPRGWLYCNGSLLSIAQNSALFSLLGTTYGGDGRVTFGVPDLRGRVPVGHCGGTGPGLSPRPLGQKSGQETHVLITQEIPAHRHTLGCNNATGTLGTPVNNVPAVSPNNDDLPPAPTAPLYAASANSSMKGDIGGLTGGSQGHNNMQPFLSVNFLIASVGTFPSRN